MTGGLFGLIVAFNIIEDYSSQINLRSDSVKKWGRADSKGGVAGRRSIWEDLGGALLVNRGQGAETRVGGEGEALGGGRLRIGKRGGTGRDREGRST